MGTALLFLLTAYSGFFYSNVRSQHVNPEQKHQTINPNLEIEVIDGCYVIKITAFNLEKLALMTEMQLIEAMKKFPQYVGPYYESGTLTFHYNLPNSRRSFIINKVEPNNILVTFMDLSDTPMPICSRLGDELIDYYEGYKNGYKMFMLPKLPYYVVSYLTQASGKSQYFITDLHYKK